jgi:hypothetical protein
MYKFENFTKVLLMLVAVTLFASSCGSDTSTEGLAASQDVVRLEQKIDDLTQQVEELTAPTTTETTIISPATTESSEALDANTSHYCEDYRDNFDTQMAKLNVPAGAFFYGSCTEDSMWFPAYQGSESDIWYANWDRVFRGGDAETYEGYLHDWPEIPTSAQHPAFPRALTLEELAYFMPEGSVICKHYGNDTQQLFIKEVKVHAYFYEGSMTQAVGYPKVRVYEAATSQSFDMPATDWGITPFEDGVWSVAYVTAGACTD